MARALRPRTILLDVMMPQMDGWSVLSQLKADPDAGGIPVVMVTFMNEPALGASLGAADLIPKPVDWDRLKAVMDRFRGDGRACWWWTTIPTPANGCAPCWSATAGS